MKAKYLSLVLAGLVWANAHGEEVQEAPKELSATVTFASDYIFRGMTQTWGKPALQASLDYVGANGVYASVWTSNVDSNVMAGANQEIDLSAGYNGVINPDWGYTFGVMRVFYPDGDYSKIKYAPFPHQEYNFTEANGGISYKWLSLKFYYTLTDLMGFNKNTGYTGSTRGSVYTDLSANIPLAPSWTLNLHAGHENLAADLVTPTVNGSRHTDFSDYRLALNKNLGQGWNANLAYTWNSNRGLLDNTPSNNDANATRNVGKKLFSFALSKTF
ncbi:TorF family putative porin [Azospira inquinata]|uniref:Uncharacterized protein n=1 Tax=Azospira inquinata TaxID=2785627 RepID=A0A975XV04_9RHOO|nr:TorF family putative porin [Azospira inquinata]QWT45363.1 TorF family putative porin [Azospira inquinata]QWT49305.1 hypothetical protein Azoinq_01435 [Azospira inquinata]